MARPSCSRNCCLIPSGGPDNGVERLTTDPDLGGGELRLRDSGEHAPGAVSVGVSGAVQCDHVW